MVSSKRARAVLKGPVQIPGLPDANVVRLLRTPENYPDPDAWNGLYRAVLQSKRAYLDVGREIGRVDAEALFEGFQKEQEYQEWISSYAAQSLSGTGAECFVHSLVLPDKSVCYLGGPAGFASHQRSDEFADPYVEVVVKDKAMALALVLAFKGT